MSSREETKPAEPALGLEGWQNGVLDVSRDLTVLTPEGPVQVHSEPNESRTSWALVAGTTGLSLSLTQGKRRLLGFKRFWPAPKWVRHAGLRIGGEPAALARRLADHQDIGGILRGWRAFDLEIRDGRVHLVVPTSNVDAEDARAGVRVVRAVAQELRLASR